MTRSVYRRHAVRTSAWASGIVACFFAAGCMQQTGACCGADGTCSETTRTMCESAGGRFLGDNTTCTDAGACLDEVVVLSYDGGDCPPEMTIKDGDPGNVECGVPRSRLFDDNSPLDGSMADAATGGFGTFPGADDADSTGMLVRLDGFAVNSNGPRANIVVICLNIVIPPQAGGMRAVKCTIRRAAGFKLTPEAQAVADSGKRNYWSQQARKLAKLEADAAAGVDPRAGARADRLRRRFQRKDNTDYQVLADGTRYMEEMVEMTEKIEITPATPGAILTVYLVFVGDAFGALGEFIPEFQLSLASDPNTDSPMLGDIQDNALVLESVDDVGPVSVVDFAGTAFDPNMLDLSDPANDNPQHGLFITNSSADNLTLQVPGHPNLVLPPDSEVAFDDLADADRIMGTDANGQTATLDLNPASQPQPIACCIDNVCDDTITDSGTCVELRGTPIAGATCADDPCNAPPSDPFVAAVGTYLMEGNCPGNGQNVELIDMNGQLVLRGLPENQDILLDHNGQVATAGNVTAFGLGGHDLTLRIQDMLPCVLELTLFQPTTMGACQSILTQQP